MDVSLLQAKKLEERDLQAIFGWLLLINGILFLAYFFGSTFLAIYFKEPRLDVLGKVLAFSFLLVPFRVIPNALLDRALDFKLRAQLELVATVTAAAMTLGLAYFGYGIWALVIGTLTNRLLVNILLMASRPWLIRPRLNNLPAEWALSMGGMLTLAGALSLISDQLINLVGGPRIGPELLGVLALGSQFASLPMAKFMPVINQTMIPSFAKFRDDPKQAASYFEKTLQVTALILIPMLAGMATLADEIILTIYGQTWERSALPLVVMAVGMVFRFNTVLLKNFCLSMGNARVSMTGGAVQLLLLLPATYVASGYGVLGLALAWSATEAVVTVVVFIACIRKFPLRPIHLLSCYFPAVISSLVMAVGVRFAHGLAEGNHSFAILFILIGLGAGLYALTTRLLFKQAFELMLKVVLGRQAPPLSS